jgi:hypothetical protein
VARSQQSKNGCIFLIVFALHKWLEMEVLMAFTVKDLVQKLSAFPPNLPVFVEGYEGGFSDIGSIKQISVVLDKYKEEWMGPHEEDADSKDLGIVLLRSPNPNAL